MAQEPLRPSSPFNLQADSATLALHELYLLEKAEQRGVKGYRVQIYNGNRRESLRLRTNFIDLFPGIAVYSVYEQPEFKIQVGDYRNRLDAERALAKIKEAFPGSLVVRTRIRYPE